jgi:hypothetical protein
MSKHKNEQGELLPLSGYVGSFCREVGCGKVLELDRATEDPSLYICEDGHRWKDDWTDAMAPDEHGYYHLHLERVP